jgi:RNA polymerase sigma-70 factor (ECF subfamily)
VDRPAVMGWASRVFGQRAAEVPVAEATDELLLELARTKNDEAAVRELIERYGDRLLAIVDAAHGDLDLSEDIVQETFIRAIRQSHQLRAAASLFPWLVRIAIRVALDQRRKTRRETFAPEAIEIVAPEEQGPHARAEAAQDAAQVDRAISRLPDYPRELIILRYFASFSVAELAGVFDKTETAIRKDLQRARERLRTHLSPWFEGRAR